MNNLKIKSTRKQTRFQDGQILRLINSMRSNVKRGHRIVVVGYTSFVPPQVLLRTRLLWPYVTTQRRLQRLESGQILSFAL